MENRYTNHLFAQSEKVCYKKKKTVMKKSLGQKKIKTKNNPPSLPPPNKLNT